MRYGGISICRHGLKTRNQSLESIDDGIYDCVRFQRMCNSAERLDGRALMDDLLRSSRMCILALKKNSTWDNFEMKCESLLFPFCRNNFNLQRVHSKDGFKLIIDNRYPELLETELTFNRVFFKRLQTLKYYFEACNDFKRWI